MLRADARQADDRCADAGRRGDQVAVGRAVEQLADRRRRGDAEDLPPHLDRRASRGRDGPLSDGDTALPTRRRCWARSSRIDARGGNAHSLAVAQGFVRNQGDAWTWALDQVQPRARRSRRAARPRPRRADDDIDATIDGLRRDDRPPARRHARRAGAAEPTIRPSRRARPAARTSRRWIERAMALVSRAPSTPSPRASDWDDESGRSRCRRAASNEPRRAGRALRTSWRERGEAR